MKMNPFHTAILLCILAMACQKKKASCMQDEPVSQIDRPESALYTIHQKDAARCMAVQIAPQALLTTRDCIKEACSEGDSDSCESKITLRHLTSSAEFSIKSIQLFPDYERQNFVSVRGSDLALIRVAETLKSRPIAMASSMDAQFILEDNRSRILEDDRQYLLLARNTAPVQWLSVNSRFPMGLQSQEFLVGFSRRQVCATERGSALLGRRSETDPYQLLGIVSNGHPGPDWLKACEHSDGNVVSLLSAEAVQAWISDVQKIEGDGRGEGEPKPMPLPQPGPEPQKPESEGCR